MSAILDTQAGFRRSVVLGLALFLPDVPVLVLGAGSSFGGRGIWDSAWFLGILITKAVLLASYLGWIAQPERRWWRAASWGFLAVFVAATFDGITVLVTPIAAQSTEVDVATFLIDLVGALLFGVLAGCALGAGPASLGRLARARLSRR